MPRVTDLAPCPVCSGRLMPVSRCKFCDAATVRGNLQEVGPGIGCPKCGATNPTQFACSQCITRLSYLEVVKVEWPTAGGLKEEFEATFHGWAKEGYDVSRLLEVLEKEPDRARSAFFQFAQNVRTVEVLREVVDALDPEGLESDLARVRELFRAPYQSLHIEAEVAKLLEKAGVWEFGGKAREPLPGRSPRTPESSGRVFRRNDAEGLHDRAGVPPMLNVGRRGLINGRGLVNGRGRVNGLINGTGFVNGGALTELRLPQKSVRTQYVAIAFAFLMATAIIATLQPPETHPTTIAIDGSFADWQGIPVYVDGTDAANPDVRLRSISVAGDESRVFLRAQVAGAAFGDRSGYDTMYAFLDTDGARATGYNLSDIGADFLVRISGYNGLIADTSLLKFEGRNPVNWNGWKAIGSVAAAARGSNVEMEVSTSSLERFDERALRVRFAFDDNEGDTSHTLVPVGPSLGALRVTQRALATTLGAVPEPFLELRFEAVGAGARVVVRQVYLETTTGTFGAAPANFVVVQGTPVVHIVTADATGLPPGTLVSAGVRAVVADQPHVVLGVAARAYAGQPASGKRIDGLFADWPDPIPDMDSSPIRRSGLDVVSRDGATSGEDLFLYARLAGPALAGSLVPDRVARPPPSGGNPAEEPVSGPPPPRVGEDYIRFFIDTNESDGGGTAVGGLAADRLVEVRGLGGRVTNASTYRWSGADWAWDGAAATGLGAEELEVGAAVPAAGFNRTRVLVITADWSGIADVTDGEATRGEPGFLPLHGVGAQLAVARRLAFIPVVDGDCGSFPNEYEGADLRGNKNLTFYVGQRRGLARLYVCIEAIADKTDEGVFDFGELLFDRFHNGGPAPQPDDRRIWVTSGGAFGFFGQDKGDGFGWVPCGGSCDAGNEAFGQFNFTNPVYEFNISFWDVWGRNNTLPNQVAGFAIQVHDDLAFVDYKWGSSNVDQNVPDRWGHLVIPEFLGPVPVAMAVVSLVSWWRRRRGRSKASVLCFEKALELSPTFEAARDLLAQARARGAG